MKFSPWSWEAIRLYNIAVATAGVGVAWLDRPSVVGMIAVFVAGLAVGGATAITAIIIPQEREYDEMHNYYVTVLNEIDEALGP